jgi:hypothetical protein
VKQKIILVALLAFLSCRSSDNQIFEIDPRNFIDNRITLSEIAEDIHYIPLDNSFPIGITYSLRISGDYFYISVKDVGIVQFNNQGKVVCKIGNKGRGPGEYNYGIEFTVDERTKNVYVLDIRNIKVFSQTGRFLRNISYERYLGGYRLADGIDIYNSLLVLPDYIVTGNSKLNWLFIDTLGKLISKKENSITPFQTNFGMRANMYQFGGKLYYYNFFNDTIFSITSDLVEKVAYLFAKGEFRWPRGSIKVTSESQIKAQLFKLFMPAQLFETKDYIVLLYNFLEKSAICLIEKDTKKTFLAYKEVEIPGSLVKTTPCLINDLDGGMPINEDIKYYYLNGEEFLITLINPFDLKSLVSSNKFKNSTPKFPKKKKELEKLANSLKETDNPVLMMVRLKK